MPLFLIENEDNQAWYYGLQTSLSARFPNSFYTQIGATAQFSYLIQKTQITPVINAPALNMTFDIGYQNARNGWDCEYQWMAKLAYAFEKTNQ
jgi:hypothetical protein